MTEKCITLQMQEVERYLGFHVGSGPSTESSRTYVLSVFPSLLFPFYAESELPDKKLWEEVLGILNPASLWLEYAVLVLSRV